MKCGTSQAERTTPSTPRGYGPRLGILRPLGGSGGGADLLPPALPPVVHKLDKNGEVRAILEAGVKRNGPRGISFSQPEGVQA